MWQQCQALSKTLAPAWTSHVVGYIKLEEKNMEIITSLDQMAQWSSREKRQGRIVGLVPTMGYLHQGHLSLIRAARLACDQVVVSIFVNPLQFGLGEDYEVYPRDLSRDQELAVSAGADVIFAPTVAEMYPKGYHTYVQVEELTSGLCGRSRPTHFRGVTTVVSKLLNIVQPDKAYFGQKDAQQLVVIQRMVQDLNMPVGIVPCPIVREADGLAMSSRNVYLSPEERQQALVLSRAIAAAGSWLEEGQRDGEAIRAGIRQIIATAPLAEIDYVEVVDGVNLEPLAVLQGPVLIALAVRFGKTRLLDNLMREV